jgi:hypothetical protein
MTTTVGDPPELLVILMDERTGVTDLIRRRRGVGDLFAG